MQFTGEGQEGEAVLELFCLCVRCVRMWGLSGAPRELSLGAFLPQKARAFLPLLIPGCQLAWTATGSPCPLLCLVLVVLSTVCLRKIFT